MRQILFMGALAAASFTAMPAAAVDFYVGPTNAGPQAPVGFEKIKLYTDFNSGAPSNLVGGGLRTGSNDSIYAAPYGDSTQYYAVGPQAGSPATLTISGFDRVSFYWGSIDFHNKIEFLGDAGAVLQSFTGSQILPNTVNPWGSESHTVTFTLNPLEAAAVRGIRFSSAMNAFEFDNLAVGSAPEPAVWMTMMLGLGLAGGALRRRKARVHAPARARTA